MALKSIIAFIVSLAMFMEGLDATVINTAIPAMSVSLSVSPIDLKIALISYLLSLAVFIPISGWLADKFGIKRVFINALIIFLLSSLACGLSRNLWQLVISRVVQGFGGAMMLPVGRLIILRTFDRTELLSAMNRVVIIGALGSMLGPVLGGVISYHWAWYWIFWINIPVGLVALLLARRYLPKSAPTLVPALDGVGFLLFGGGLCLFTFALAALSESMIPLGLSFCMLMAAVFLLMSYFFHSRSVAQPIIQVKLFCYRTFQVSILANLFTRLGFGGIPFLLPLLLQLALGYSSEQAGMLLAPLALGMMSVKFMTARLLQGFGYKKLLIVNTLLVSVVLLSFTLIKPSTSFWTIGALCYLFGIVLSVQYSSMNSLAYAEIPPNQLSAASSIASTTQQLAQSFGVAICALLLQSLTPQTAEQVFNLLSFQHVFWALSLITLCSSAVFLRLNAKDGAQLL